MSKLSFEDWLELNEAELLIEFAESGADRELDFDSEREIEERYDTYCRGVDRELTQTIWKFPIDIKDINVIKMPEATQILTVQIDESTDRVCMWGLVTPGKFVDRTFQIFGTGHTINLKAKKRYIGTFQKRGFVGHIFEIFKSKNHDMEFNQYRRKQIAELRPVNDQDLLQFVRKRKIMVDDVEVSISAQDIINGSPVDGDMIARNPENHKDQWLVAKKYFEDNFEKVITDNLSMPSRKKELDMLVSKYITDDTLREELTKELDKYIEFNYE